MSAQIIPIANARRARDRAPLLNRSEREAYAAAIAKQRRKRLSEDEIELEQMIGPPGGGA